jgi:hypothetical protein
VCIPVHFCFFLLYFSRRDWTLSLCREKLRRIGGDVVALLARLLPVLGSPPGGEFESQAAGPRSSKQYRPADASLLPS